MWKSLFLISTSALAAQTPAPKETAPPPPVKAAPGAPTTADMMISPSSRALDFQQAYELMRAEKSTSKVYFELADGSIVSNIIEMHVLQNSTLILFRYTSNQEIRYKVVKIEDIRDLRY